MGRATGAPRPSRDVLALRLPPASRTWFRCNNIAPQRGLIWTGSINILPCLVGNRRGAALFVRQQAMTFRDLAGAAPRAA